MYVEAKADQNSIPWEPPAAFATGPLRKQWMKYWSVVMEIYGGVLLTHSTDDLMTSIIAFLSWWAKQEYKHAVDPIKRTTSVAHLDSHTSIEELLAFLNDEEEVKVPRSLTGERPGTVPRPLPGASNVFI
jgi:hypothetical protein